MLIRRTVSHRHDGTEILRATYSTPPDLPPFLTDLISAAESYVDTTLRTSALEAFHADPNPNKRFYFHRFQYDLNIEITPTTPTESTLTIAATLTQAGPPQQTRLTYRLRPADGTLLPPKKGARRRQITEVNPKNSAK